MAYQTAWNGMLRADEVRKLAEQREERFGTDKGLGFAYRFEEVSYSTIIDAEAEIYGSRLELELRAYFIQKKTPKGFWIEDERVLSFDGSQSLRFINNDWNKRFACPTLEEAIESFKARKQRQIRIYEGKISVARVALKLLEQGRSC